MEQEEKVPFVLNQLGTDTAIYTLQSSTPLNADRFHKLSLQGDTW